MQRNIVETVLGAVVLIVAGAFLFFFYQTTDIKPATGYVLTAEFDKVDGLETGSPVRIGGVKVGQVLDFELDTKTYRAVVRMNLDNKVQLPTDSSAVITSAGLLDGKFMTLQPGSDEEMLKDGGRIMYTQSTASLEQMLGQVIFSLTKDKDKKEEPAEEKKEEKSPDEKSSNDAPEEHSENRNGTGGEETKTP